MPNWPIPTAVCIDCRIALRPGERCDWMTHHVAELDSEDDVGRLMLEVWGRQVETYAGWLDIEPVLRREFRRPEGAREGPLRPYYSAPIVGRVMADATLPSPVMQTDCVAYGLTVIGAPIDERPVLLRDNFALPFWIECKDGRTIHIGGGHVDVMSPGERTGKSETRHYLAALRPKSLSVGEPTPFAIARAFEASVRPGDTIALFNNVVVEADARAVSTPYRQAAATRETAKGTPCFELRKP